MSPRIDLDDLPSTENSHRFAGEDHGGIPVSLFVVHQTPGTGPRLHRHEYPEVFVLQEGEATFRLGGEEVVARGGQIVVAPAGVPHAYTNTGPGTLHLLAIQPAAVMEAEFLEPE